MRLASLLAFGASVLLAVPALRPQTCELVCDINQIGTPFESSPNAARRGPGNTFAPGFVKCGSNWFFTATDGTHGSELWKTDGTAAGTMMVMDIHPGLSGSSPFYLVCCGNTVFFRATNGTDGLELWKSDGTAAGTVMVKDIFAGSSGSTPSFLECMNGRVYFYATDGLNGFELWCSNGTAAGTFLLKDIRPGTSSSSPRYLAAIGGNVYFQANDGSNGTELWKTDGTTAGTVMVKDIHTGAGSSSPIFFQALGGKVVFRASSPATGTELYTSDGTTAGTFLLKDIRPGTASGSPGLVYRAVIGNHLMFSANNGTTGSELWKTDGTTAGTVLVKDIYSGTGSSLPTDMTVVGSTMFFAAFTGGAAGTGKELWKSDGTTAGTVLVRDIRPGAVGSSPQEGVGLGGKYYFEADDGVNGDELWQSDGTAAGTTIVKNAVTGSGNSDPSFLTAISATQFIYSGRVDGAGTELMISAGTAAGTTTLKDIYPAAKTASSSPADLYCCTDGRTMYFQANDGTTGSELWMRDANGCRLVKDIRPGNSDSSPSNFACCWLESGKLVTFFTAADGSNGTELWMTDGTSTGTVLVKDIRPGTSSSAPRYLTCCKGRLFFTANDGSNGTELWVSNGTAAGTVMLKDIRSGFASGAPNHLTCCKGMVFFSATDGTSGAELWVSDGTPAGTAMLKDIYPGGSGSSPDGFTRCGDKVVFRATNTGVGAELWMTDGTAAGTTMIKDILSGTSSSSPRDFTKCGKVIYFVANGGEGFELWKTDLTAAGTLLVKDIHAGTSSSSPNYLTCCEGTLYFSAFTSGIGGTGRELWKSDGTAAGTVLVKDIFPGGTNSSSPTSITCAGKRVYFSAFVSSSVSGNGAELWCSDGTAAGTVEICDIYAGSRSSSPSELTACGGRIYCSATSLEKGAELYAIDGAGALAINLGDEGSTDAFSTLRSSNPILGGSAMHTYDGGPADHIGLALMGGGNFGPIAHPLLVEGACAYLDPLRRFLLLGGVAPPKGSFALGIPNVATLTGLKVNTQIWWVSLSTVVPIEVTNGVQLTLGGD